MGVDAGGTFERKHDLKEFASIQSHGGLGLAVTDKGILVNVLVHFAAYLPSALCIIGTIWGGWWTWLTFIVGWVAVPIFDLLIGADSYNLTPEEEKAWAASVWFRVVTWFHFPIQVVTVTFGAYWVGTHELSWLEWLGITFSIGTAEGFGIGCVHELIHRPHTIDFMSGVLSLVWSNYGHFWIEHLWGHHRNVASPLDPASSDVGDNAWVFVAKCMWKSFFEAWGIESKILKSRGKGTFSPENRIIQAYLLTWTVAGAYYHFFGVQALPFFFAQGFIAAWIVDNTNYIEHYGLRRKEIKPGVFERVGWLHAWDTPELLTNSLLFKIQRHPDHHTNAGRPYQILRTFPQAPTLPTGYAGMIVLSWFPPLYWYVMNWRVELVKEQEREFRATGKILGEDYPFPDGARAVYSFDSEADKLFIPSEFVEKSTTNQPKFDQYKALKSGRQGVSEYSRNRATRGALLFLLVALLGVAAAVSFSEAGGPLRLQVDRALQGLPRPSLFERLGGLEKIKPLVHSIYLKHKLDPITGEWFEGKDHAAIEQRVVEFFAAGTGGDVEYIGRDATGLAFLAVQDHVLSSLEEFGYNKVLRDEVLGMLFKLKPQIRPEQAEPHFLNRTQAETGPLAEQASILQTEEIEDVTKLLRQEIESLRAELSVVKGNQSSDAALRENDDLHAKEKSAAREHRKQLKALKLELQAAKKRAITLEGLVTQLRGHQEAEQGGDRPSSSSVGALGHPEADAGPDETEKRSVAEEEP